MPNSNIFAYYDVEDMKASLSFNGTELPVVLVEMRGTRSLTHSFTPAQGASYPRPLTHSCTPAQGAIGLGLLPTP